MSRIGGAKALRMSLIAVLVLLLLAALSTTAGAQTPAANTAKVDVPFGEWAAYSVNYTGGKLGITMTYSPSDDPKDYGKTVANAKAVTLDVFAPGSNPASGKPMGSAGGTKGKKFVQIESGKQGEYVLVVHNWDSLKRTVSVTLTTTGPALKSVSGGAGVSVSTTAASTQAAPAAGGAPKGVLEIVSVRANAADANVIAYTLADGKTIARTGATGLENVSIGVPVTLKASSATGSGAATKFAWTLTTPSASKSALDKKDAAVVKFTPDVVGVYKVDVVVSNAAGNSPMASVQINAGTYVGVEKGGCKTCHPGEVKEWAETGHGVIMEEEIQGGVDPAISHYGEGCLRCHTTGYNPGVANGGFGDAQTKTGWKFPALEDIQKGKVKFSELPAEIQNMGNIQCEDCHGPAQQHVSNKAPMAASLDVGVCNVCHDGGGHHIKGTEFVNSKHGEEESQAWTYPTGPARQDCVRCHSGAGYISFIKNPTEKASWNNTAEPLTCAGCHDPHSDANKFQLRIVGKAVEIPGGISKDYGLSATCAECHNARNTGADAAKGSTPHYSAAAEMMAGTGGVTYGQQILDTPHGMIVGASPMKNPDPAAAAETPEIFGGATPGPCVACHMYPTTAEKDYQYKVGEHSFGMTSPDGKFANTAACQTCHPGVKDFNFAAKADYDGSGKAETVEAEVAGLLKKLQGAIKDAGVKPVEGHPYFDAADKAKASPATLNAIYNYLFVRGLEGTDGKANAIHNFKRSVMLLQLSYKDLTGKDVPGATILK